MLNDILSFCERQSSSDGLNQTSETIARVYQALAIVSYLLHNNDKATPPHLVTS